MTLCVSPAESYSSTPTSRYWLWHRCRVHYLQAGEGRTGPPLLLVHGCGASAEHWLRNIDGLAHRHPVYAIDLLGFGSSDKPPLHYSVELWKHQLKDFCREVIRRPAVVVGNSLGGLTALMLAADCPEQVAGVTLLNSAGHFKSELPRTNAWFARLGRRLGAHPWLNWLLFQCLSHPRVIRRVLLRLYRDPSAVTEQLIELIRRPSQEPGAAAVFQAACRAWPKRTVDELLARLRQPLLLLWGQWDPCVQLWRAHQMRRLYPAALLHLIPAGHCPHDERPDLVNQYLLDWCAQF